MEHLMCCELANNDWRYASLDELIDILFYVLCAYNIVYYK